MPSDPSDLTALKPPTTATSQVDSESPLHETKEVSHRDTDRDSDAHENYIDGVLLHVIVLCLAVAMFLVSLDTTIISTAIPQITDEFNSTADVGWYGAAFLLGSAVTQAPWGKLYGFFDIKWTYLLSLLMFDLEWGVSKSWHDRDVIGCLVGFPILAGLFITNEFFWNDRAMIPRRLLLKKEVIVNLIVIFLLAGAFFMLLYYMPIYFQTVKGNSAQDSGIRTLPLIVSAGVMAVFGAIGFGISGYPTPFLLFGAMLISVGAGLLYTLDLVTPSSHWIPYQILAGLGIGAALQVPIIMNQATVDASDMSTMTSITLFFKCMGASVFMQTGQTIFLEKVKRNLDMMTVADVSPNQILTGGLVRVQAIDSASSIALRAAYLGGLKDVFLLVAALSGLAALLASLMGRYKMDTARLRL
ncbi:hypothetical protein AnigIFM62618_001773 [Aspergillus niger]|nr:hypothetical protein AnigIFM62618_001773 [Aspergillus niger]